MKRWIGWIALGTVLAGMPAAAREYSPRVVSPQRADAYSMKTFAQFPRWRGLEGDRLAWEVYCYLADTRSGLFHMNPAYEGDDALSEYTIVRDPVKAVNVYGYAFCGALGPIMAGVAEDMGWGRARTLSLPAWHHVACEARYGRRWHYLDLDVRAVFRRDDGSLASMADARTDPTLWKNRGPLFFPNDPLDSTQRVYRQTPVEHYHGFNQSGHTMDYALRQGETFTRWWTPQGGRWHHHPSYNRQDWLRRLLEQEPRGPKPNHRDFTIYNYGNGRFVYQPELSSAASDFADGAYDARNVRPGESGLTLVEPGEGYAVFEVRTPYIIVPKVGDLETTEDDSEASVVEFDADGARWSISLDNGLTWSEPQPVTAGHFARDLTPQVAGTYGYLLKVLLKGRPGEAVLRRMKLTTWVQVAPASLPALAAGVNRMEYRTGDDRGLKTRVIVWQSSAARPEGLLKYLVEPPADYDPARKTARVRGPMIVRATAPPGAKIAWLTASGSFNTHQMAAAGNTRNTIAYALDQRGDFREIYRADVPPDTQHWHYNAARRIELDEPAPVVFLRYVGDPGVNDFAVYAHCLDDARASARPVRITHVWRENGQRKTHRVELQQPGSYEVRTGADPQNESIEIAVPSDGRGEKKRGHSGF